MTVLACFLGFIALMQWWTNRQLQKERDFYKSEAIDVYKRASRYTTFALAEAELSRKFNKKRGKK